MRTLLLAIGYALLAGCSTPLEEAQTQVTHEFAGLAPEIWQGVEGPNGVVTFRGIPFAAPPVAGNRWQPPQAYVPKAGIRVADQFPAACMQGPHTVRWYQSLIRSLGKDPELFPHPNQGYSEDCLYINLWTPDVPKAASANPKLPVMVWIHGGSNKGGWSFEPDYLGGRLAQRGVVVVNLAYRLGAFGFFSHPELVDEQATASNYGLLDLIAGLQWVQDHIAAFGGDPSNVTIVGESAGAANIGYLLSSPAATNLFHRAIHQSGGYQLHFTPTLEEQTEVGSAVSQRLDLDLAGLRALPGSALLAALATELPHLEYGPGIGGHALPKSPALALPSNPNQVPLLIGTNANEGLMYLAPEQTLASTLQSLNLTNQQAQVLQQLADVPTRVQMDRLITAPNMRCPSYEMASATAQAQLPAWVYQFNRVRKGKHWESVGAYHGAEIPYLFDTHADWLETDPQDRLLTERMQRYWVNFARSGNPNGSGLPNWPAWGNSRILLELNANIQPLSAPDDWLCRLLKQQQPRSG